MDQIGNRLFTIRWNLSTKFDGLGIDVFFLMRCRLFLVWDFARGLIRFWGDKLRGEISMSASVIRC